MKALTPTIYGARLQTLMSLGLPYQHLPNSTLNEKFGVQPNAMPDNPAITYPTTQYFCIGNKGHRSVIGADDITIPADHWRDPTAPALFNHLPFVMRAPSDDLTPNERQRYAMRAEINHGGRTWIAYYLRALDLSNVSVTMKIDRTINGVTTSTPFAPDNQSLNPQPIILPNTGVITSSGDSVSVVALMNLNFNQQDVDELLNVADILYGNRVYAKISEIGLVAAARKQVEAQAVSGGTFRYIEAVQAQIVSFMGADHSAYYNNLGFDITLGLGASEPLLAYTSGF